MCYAEFTRCRQKPLKEIEIETTAGVLSGTLTVPAQADCALLLAHGAGADHKHSHMESLAGAFASVGIASLRFNFPFKQFGRKRVDSAEVSMESIVAAANFLDTETDLPLFIVAAKKLLDCHGLLFCSFPLHPAGKPGVERAAHLIDIDKQMLFISGTRDSLAEQSLMQQEADKLKNASVHWLDTADHSYKILKRSRVSDVDVYEEAATVASAFIKNVAG